MSEKAILESSDASLLRRTIKNSLAGTVAGIAVCLVGHPFDTLKVRLQTQSIQKPVYSGLIDCFLKTLKWEGIGGLYKGVASPIVGQMFFRATLFTSFYQFSTLLAGPNRIGKRLDRWEYFVAGSMTGFVASFVESPIDLFKTKLQIQIMQSKAGEPLLYKNVFHAGYIITKQYGHKGFYQGLSSTILRDTPAFGVYFGFYELTKELLTPANGDVTKLPSYKLLIAGGTGGLLYWLLLYPTDVIKSSMQSDHMEKDKRKYKNIYDCATKLYSEEGGVKRFFKGFTPCIMRSIPANAVMLLVMEKARNFLDPYI